MDASFSFCRTEEIDEVMEFIDQHWKHGHIMATDHELVDFMHKTADGYNYAVARADKRLVGMLGFIPTSQYDSALADNRDVCLAMWKSVGDIGTGLSLQNLVCERAMTVGVPGINDKVARIYKWLGFSVVEMRHFFIPNDGLSEFRIASIDTDDLRAKDCAKPRCKLVPLTENEVLDLQLTSCWRPFKSGRYLVNRYQHHPVYDYRIWAAKPVSGGEAPALFVTRKIAANGSSCERIVDIAGDVGACGSIRNAWLEILRKENAEYVDCVEYGLSDEEMLGLGFQTVKSETIIPNYFDPFLRENVVIKAAVLNRTKDLYALFRGDGDQDRPNRR